MFTLTLLRVIEFILLAGLTNALTLPALANPELAKRSNGTGVVKFDVSLKQGSRPRTNRLFQGKLGAGETPDTVVTGLESYVYYYNLDLKFGSNEQPIGVQIDTGSSNLWVPTKDAKCSCTFPFGTYDASSSTTFRNLSTPFQIGYGGGDTAYGTYVEDQIEVPGGLKLDNVTFAAVYQTTRNLPILGTGFDSSNKNLPAYLKQNGYINKNAYSLYLGDDNTGNILFGGIDYQKFYGVLTDFPILDGTLSIKLDSITDNGGTQRKVNISSILLDSGTADIYLPQDLFLEMGNAIGAHYDQKTNSFYLDSCTLPSDEYLTFNFGNVGIKVPYSDLPIPGSVSGKGKCDLGLHSSVDLYNINILGVSVLRYSYTVFNLDDNVISLAQVKDTTNSDIQAIQ